MAGLLIVLWLGVGLIAATQRGYFGPASSSCGWAATVALTVISGPLNYSGVNPEVNCQLPAPSE
jgi:hypothetical protein